MSYRLINANELNTVIASEDYDKVLKMPCIYADLPNGMDGKHYIFEQKPCDKCEVGNPCLYCKYEFETQESEG